MAKMCIMNPWCYALYLENHNYPAGKLPLSNFIFSKDVTAFFLLQKPFGSSFSKNQRGTNLNFFDLKLFQLVNMFDILTVQLSYLDVFIPTYTLCCNDLVFSYPCYQVWFVGNAKNSESLSINIPNGLLPSPGAKHNTFSKSSVISGCLQ